MVRFSKLNSLRINQIAGDKAPRYNVKATLVPCPGTPYVFLFGGFDEFDNLDSNVYLLNIEIGTWEIDDKHVGLYREGHSAVYIGDGNILVFGGIPHDEFPVSEADNTNGSGTSRTRSSGSGSSTTQGSFAKDNLMMIYNVYTKNWVGPPHFTLLNAPSSRSRHACCLSPDGSKVYISGGLVNSSPLNDLYCYDLISGNWTGPIEFVARFDHFISEFNGKLYSFGGLNKDMNHVNHTLTWFDLKDHSIGELILLRKPINPPSKVIGNYEGNEEEEDDEEDEEMDLNINKRIFQTFNSAECEHIYMDSIVNSEVKIDVSLPSWGSTKNNREYSISSFNISEFRYIPLINLSTNSSQNDRILYDWKHSFVSGDGILYLLGHSLTDSISQGTQNPDSSDTRRSVSQQDAEVSGTEFVQDSTVNTSMDEPEASVESSSRLSYYLAINLSDLGVPKTNAVATGGSMTTTSSDLSLDFMNLLLTGDFSDFEILTLADNEVKEEYNKSPEVFHNMIDKVMNGEPLDTHYFKSIKVHKSILLARWSHFQRLISSGMTETFKSMMFIPEPFLWIQGMIFYIYTDSINFERNVLSSSIISIIDYSGMLVLSNLYDLPHMRSRLLQKLYHLMSVLSTTTGIRGNNVSESMVESILKVWENALVTEEPAFLLCVTAFIRDRWSIFLRSKAFKDLPKDLIIKLCEDCTDTVIPRVASRKHSRDSSTPEPEVLRILNGSPETPPSNVGRTLRSSHSNSPFLRHTTRNGSPTTTNSESQPGLIRTSASFPILRNFDDIRSP